MSFGILSLLVVAGLVGPLLAAANRRIPVVVGEIAGGLVIGASGFKLVRPSDPTFTFLSDVGFAMLMFIVGTHLPFRDPRLRSVLKRGAAAVATTVAVAAVAAFLMAPGVGFDRPLVLAVLMATSSAAVAMPILQGVARSTQQIPVVTSWIAVADVGTVLAVPLVMATGRLDRVLAGGAIVLVLAGLAYFVQRRLMDRPAVHRTRRLSKRRGWGLDLRISILILFFLSWIATIFGTSILIAGFATGAVVSLLGEPKRVAQQLVGLGEGFFVPLFFVSLGARLDFRALATHPTDLMLGAGVLAGALVAHLIAARVWRLPASAGLVASAQLGVPSAVVTLGLEARTMTPPQAAAVMAAVVGSLAACSIGASLLGSEPEATDEEAT
ncbi:MAG TPA: cation:proton antiporter [Actinomycetota bacterium]